jgi:alcohol dehydrogenase
MRELTFIEPGRTEWREIPEPTVTPAGAIVRPIAAANCDVDTAILRGTAPFAGPFAIGHEFVAEIVAIGEEVATLATADVVVVPWKIFCGDCDRCRRGVTSGCSALPRLAMYGLPIGGHWGGGFSDLVAVPFADAMLIKVPSGIEPATIASGSDNLPDAWRCVAPFLAEHPDADVLVVGGGARSIGLYAAGIAKALGARRVDYVDRADSRLRIAEALGATPLEYARAPRRLGPYAITVDASARPEGLRCALCSTAPGGNCTTAGMFFEDVPFPLLDMYGASLTYRLGPCETRSWLPAVFDFLLERDFDPGPVTAEVVSWDDAPAAYSRLTTKTIAVRDRLS